MFFKGESMKYLYLMLRLFFCPHKWKFIGKESVCEFNRRDSIAYVSKCARCGKISYKKIW
jgi:hypothetical protein